MENNNSFTAILIILAIAVCVAIYLFTSGEDFSIQTKGLRKFLHLRPKRNERHASSSPATQLMTDWYIQIANIKDGEKWEDHYDIKMSSDQDEYLIGRNEDADLKLPDSTVSGEHGAIYRDSDGVFHYENRSRSNQTLNLDTREPIEDIELSEGLDILIGIYELQFHRDALIPVLQPSPDKTKKPPKKQKNSQDTLSVGKFGKMSDPSETKIWKK